MKTQYEYRVEALKFQTVKIVFAIGYLFYMTMGFVVSAQSLDAIQEKIATVREMSIINAGEIGLLKAKVDRNSEDIRALTASVAEVSQAMNRFTGIGIAIGALGAVIVLMQTVGFVKRRGSQ